VTKVLFRVDADPRVGLGHLQRSLSLAAALRACGVESIFITQADSHSHGRVQSSGFPISTPPTVGSWTAQDAKETAATAQLHGCKAIVVDSYDANASYLAQLRSAGLYVIARDDLAAYPFPCQMVVNGNADAPQLAYYSSSEDSLFLLGPEYIVLGQEFQEMSQSVVRQSVKTILVILGGTDHYGLMPKILTSLTALPGEFTLTAVVGPYFQNIRQVESAAEQAGRVIDLVRSPGSVRHLMLEADLAVSAAGQTLYELACARCPTVAISVAANQQGQLKALAESGFLVSVGDAQEDEVIAATRQAVSCLLPDVKARSAMAAVGKRLVDGKGALRVARAIQAKIG